MNAPRQVLEHPRKSDAFHKSPLMKKKVNALCFNAEPESNLHIAHFEVNRVLIKGCNWNPKKA